MSDTPASPPQRRQPQVFDADDPALISEPAAAAQAIDRPTRRISEESAPASPADVDEALQRPERQSRRSGPGWAAILISALAGLFGLAASLAFARFVSDVLARSDWIGIAGWSFLGIAAVAGLVIVLRELIGLLRLGRLARLRRDAEGR